MLDKLQNVSQYAIPYARTDHFKNSFSFSLRVINSYSLLFVFITGIMLFYSSFWLPNTSSVLSGILSKVGTCRDCAL